MSSRYKTLYIGVTSDLVGRVWEHKTKAVKVFTSKYNCTELVYLEDYDDIKDAIAREKQLKGWKREKKVCLIEKENQNWDDLSETYGFYS